MSSARQVTSFTPIKWISYVMLVVIIAPSCLNIKNAPKNKPFVFNTNIKVTGKVSSNEKRLLKEALENQIDDSLKARKVYTVALSWALIQHRLSRPPV